MNRYKLPTHKYIRPKPEVKLGQVWFSLSKHSSLTIVNHTGSVIVGELVTGQEVRYEKMSLEELHAKYNLSQISVTNMRPYDEQI